MARLQGNVLEISQLLPADVEEMFDLFYLYFDHVTRAQFEIDLQEKKWAILLRDRVSGRIKGFSTQMLMEREIDGVPVKAIFSGDTIIHKNFWGESELARVWLNFVFSLVSLYGESKLYWFLIAMGYKTYRFLPVYFNEFYPNFNRETPEFEQRVLDGFASSKYPLEYSKTTGIIRNLSAKETLKSGVAHVSPARFKNPDINFFIKKNPGYESGDELACMTRIDVHNLTSVAHRVMRAKGERSC